MPLVDALAGPDLRQRHEPFAEIASAGLIFRDSIRRDRDANLVQHDLAGVAHLVPLLADDRHLAGLWNEELAELLELGSGRVAPGEDAEVDANLEAGRLLLGHERDGVLDLH